MSTVTDDRCGYQLNVGLTAEDFSTDPCGRPVWEDHDRCIWHAKVDEKTTQLLEDAHPTPDENLDGAYLQEAELVGVDWFAGTSLARA